MHQGAATGLMAAFEADTKAKNEQRLILQEIQVQEPKEILANQSETEGQLSVLDADIQALAGKCAEIQAGISAAHGRAMAFVSERGQFSGKDIGNCSRCGHPVDSAHIEKEIQRIDAGLSAAKNEAGDLKPKLKEAQDLLGTKSVTKSQLQADVREKTIAMQLQAVRAEKLVAANKAVEIAASKLVEAQANAEKSQAELDRLRSLITDRQPAVEAAKRSSEDVASDLAAKKQAGSKIGSLQGQLEALRKQDADNTAAGLKEKEAFEAEQARLSLELSSVRLEHEAAQITGSTLKAQLDAARTFASDAAVTLMQASLQLQSDINAVKVSEDRIKDLQAQAQAIENQKALLESSRAELKGQEEKAELDVLACSLVDPKQGLPVFLIDQALPFLEDRINFYMNQLGMDRLTVELTTLEGDKETLAVLVDNGRPGPRLDIAAFSGGQLDRVEYAIKCAMADLARQARGVTFGLVCYDEPTGGLDEEGKQGLIKLLHERCEAYPVTMLVSHDEALIRAFDHRLQFSQGVQDETLVAA